MRPIFGFSSCAARSRSRPMRSLRCSELHPHLDHLDRRISRRGFRPRLFVATVRPMVVCTGSNAYDYILNFKGRFREHILPDKTHILNLSFLVDDLQKRRGGVAGNYAYNLSLLGDPAAVLATAGDDARQDRLWPEERGTDSRGLRLRGGE